MATYGGTDTSGLANADYQGRQAKLKAQMDHAQQVNQGLQGAGQQIQGGLTQGQGAIFQQEEAEKGRKLEAARSGLELDPKTGKYVETAPAAEQRQFAQGKAVAEYGLEKDYRTSQVLQRQQELNQEGERLKQETGLRQSHSAAEMAKVNLDAAREERLLTEFHTKTGQEREDARNKLNDTTNEMLEENTRQMVRLQLGDLEAQKNAIGMLSIPAQNNPKLAEALKGMLTGNSTPEGMKEVMSSLQEQRNAIAISGAAKTGYMSPLVDPTSPTMQDFYSFRKLYTRRMEGDMAAELEILKQIPEGDREGYKDFLRLSSMSQEDRVALATRAAARGYQGISMARRAAGAGSGQSAGGAGPQQQTKLGQRPQQPPSTGGGGFNPADRKYGPVK